MTLKEYFEQKPSYPWKTVKIENEQYKIGSSAIIDGKIVTFVNVPEL